MTTELRGFLSEWSRSFAQLAALLLAIGIFIAWASRGARADDARKQAQQAHEMAGERFCIPLCQRMLAQTYLQLQHARRDGDACYCEGYVDHVGGFQP